MLTATMGWEKEADKRVISLIEARFGKPLVYFKRISEPTPDADGYWHVRMSGFEGVAFVRQNAAGDVYIHGPVKAEVLNQYC